MFTGIDHLVVLSRKLSDAVETWSALGFNVLEGGAHPYGTHNALIPFQDGSYIELIAFQDPDEPHDHRWYRFLDRPGLIDYAVGVDNLPSELDRIQTRGLTYEGPMEGARERPDGEQLEWSTAPPPDIQSGELPFLIEDITDRSLRVPGDEAAIHSNGVTGIQSIVIAVRDLDEAREFYSTILDAEPKGTGAEADLSADTMTFTCGSHDIVLAYPNHPDSPVARRIQQGGDGPLRAVLTAEGLTERRLISASDATGAELLLMPVSSR